jgi:ribonuclease G
MSRQMRLRNIGGIIIGDFIDMKSRKDQQAVYQRLKERLKRDKAKTHVLPISALGIIEMTRQRAQESLNQTVYETCPYCNGRGRIKSSMSMSVELQRSLHTVLRANPDVHEVKIIVHPHLLNRLRSEDEELLVDIERRYEGRLTFRSDASLHHEKFTILNALTNQELK